MLKIKSFGFLVAGVLLIFISLYIFTRPAYWEVWDFSNTGEIGDTIGGISGPIINLLGAFLVYLSFKEQFIANSIQREALNQEIHRNNDTKEFNLLFGLFEEIKNEVDNFQFNVVEKHHGRDTVSSHAFQYKGLNAIEEFIENVERKIGNGRYLKAKSEQGSLKYILGGLWDLLLKIRNSNLSDNDKGLLENKVVFFYQVKLEPLISSILSLPYPDEDFTSYIKMIDNRFPKL